MNAREWLMKYHTIHDRVNLVSDAYSVIYGLLVQKHELTDEVAKLETEVDKWKTEANRLYGVGQDIEELRAQLETDLQALCIFEDQSSLHMLKLIADDLLATITPHSVKRARAGWLRRFVKAAANLEGT